MKTVYRLTLRALQGFTQSLRDLAFPSLPVPNYTTLCRRAKTLDVELPILRNNERRCCINRARGRNGIGRA
ncbi:MAG: hypothetical protein E5299_02408 [Burkholderia gladioli]|nr:MAG: hypothetical protein E5299_02408 [Burkholderia gladioli]